MVDLCRDYSRQANIFKPDEFTSPVTLIGAGATASWVAVLLAKLGIYNVTVYDFDTVGEHNLPNQMFKLADVGKAKVDALAEGIKEITGFGITTVNDKADKNTKLSGIVFLLTDTMASRKEIWHNCLRYNPNVKMVIETRMGLRDGRLYCVNPMNPEHVVAYELTLYDDTETEVSACGTSQSVAPTATLVASMAVWKLLKWHNRKAIKNEIIMDIENGLRIDNTFGGSWEA
jgi:molybdopterin/thiamine biosynthesis adenylyltransferase